MNCAGSGLHYYNEWDKHAAAWLRELIKEGIIPDGYVDERSIADVAPKDLDGYVQCHFFAGVGGWPIALRLAGWPEDRAVWTGSCPCQPFSAAGKGKGTDDSRHLWPAFRWLIQECRPAIAFGEQVASKLGREWLSGVRADLETLGYEVGAADLGDASVGAPHIRQRLWWVANSESDGRRFFYPKDNGETDAQVYSSSDADDSAFDKCRSVIGRLANSDSAGRERERQAQPEKRRGHFVASGAIEACRLADSENSNRGRGIIEPETGIGQGSKRRVGSSGGGCVVGMVNPFRQRQQKQCSSEPVGEKQPSSECSGGGFDGRLEHAEGNGRGSRRAEPVRGIASGGYWEDYELIPCADGKARRIEPGSSPLVDGIPGRASLLRGYGNAIVPQVAEVFIRSFMETGAKS